MNLKDLSAAKREAEVSRALAAVLSSLTKSVHTPEVVVRIVELLKAWGIEANDEAARKAIAKQVAGAARSCPQAASAGTFVRYGRTMTRWMWYPRDAEKVARLAEGYREGPASFAKAATAIDEFSRLTEAERGFLLQWLEEWRKGRAPIWYVPSPAAKAARDEFTERLGAIEAAAEFNLDPED